MNIKGKFVKWSAELVNQRFGFVEVNFVNLISKLTPKSNSNLTRKDTVDKLRQQHIES